MRWSVTPALREVVGADAVAAVAAADQALARGRLLGCALAARSFSRSRAASTAIALALLRCCERSSWHSATMPVGRCVMRIADVGLVDVLAAGAAGAEGVDAQLGRVERDLLGLVGLGQHRDRAGAGVDAALGLGRRHALHAVAAGFELELRVDARRPRCGPPLPCSRRGRSRFRDITSVLPAAGARR